MERFLMINRLRQVPLPSLLFLVDGFATALQNMHPGDRWEIWIPQQMGYGSAGRSASGSVIIKPYTTLIFDLEVTRIVKE